MRQTMYIPFKYDIQVLNYYLNSYFAEVQVEFNKPHISNGGIH